MAIVIGAATTVSFGTACVASAQWGFNPNVQRVYCIGEWAPRGAYEIQKPTYTLSLTVYAPSGVTYDTSPTTSCADANTLSASVTPRACGDTFDAISGQWFVTSYSYSKEDAVSPGQESWSLMRYMPSSGAIIAPTYVLRGISEGSASGTGGSPDSSELGVIFNGSVIESYSGSVSAGSFGKAYTMFSGVISRVGSGSGSSGFTGQGNASMPYTPLYL